MAIENNWPGDNRSSQATRAIGTLVLRKLARPGSDWFEKATAVSWFNIPDLGDAIAKVVPSEARKGTGPHWMGLSHKALNQLEELSTQPGAGPESTGLLLAWPRLRGENELDLAWAFVPLTSVQEADRVLAKGGEKGERNMAIRWGEKDGPQWCATALQNRQFRIAAYGLLPLSDEERTYLTTALHTSEAKADQPEPAPPNDGKEAQPVSGDSRPLNLIYYGPPGVGKSTFAKREFKQIHDQDERAIMRRVVFHPEFTQTDLIGGMAPLVVYGDGGDQYQTSEGRVLPRGQPAVVYEFIPGELTRALADALAEPDRIVYFLIEEVNRGNCAAIFAEFFQLLDRVPNGLPDAGWSEFAITRPQLLNSLRELRPDISKVLLTDEIRLPPNLWLRATMNTSDQSLMPMDAAFKRRWTLRYCPIDYESIGERRVAVQAGPEKWLSWRRFLEVINDVVTQSVGTDDKQIGPWFVTEQDISADTFRDKVLFFLWHDVFRHEPEKLFASEIRSFNRLVRVYCEGGSIFNSEVSHRLGLDEDRDAQANEQQ